MNEYILIYKGFSRSPCWCHVVVADDEKAVLVGELDDNPGTTVTNAVEQVAETIAAKLLGHRSDFAVYEYVPKGLPTLEPTFYKVVWRGGHAFSMPEWHEVNASDAALLREAEGLVMAEGYTSKALLADRKLTIIDSREPEDLPVAI